MKTITTGALLLLVLGLSPSVVRAVPLNDVPAPIAQARAAISASAAIPAQPGGEAAIYAAREAANPQLAQFNGGHTGVYIGGGAVTILLIILLIVIIL